MLLWMENFNGGIMKYWILSIFSAVLIGCGNGGVTSVEDCRVDTLEVVRVDTVMYVDTLRVSAVTTTETFYDEATGMKVTHIKDSEGYVVSVLAYHNDGTIASESLYSPGNQEPDSVIDYSEWHGDSLKYVFNTWGSGDVLVEAYVFGSEGEGVLKIIGYYLFDEVVKQEEFFLGNGVSRILTYDFAGVPIVAARMDIGL